MFKIQAKRIGNYEWHDLINMPEFKTWDEANNWLTEKNVHLIIFIDFRIVEIEPA